MEWMDATLRQTMFPNFNEFLHNWISILFFVLEPTTGAVVLVVSSFYLILLCIQRQLVDGWMGTIIESPGLLGNYIYETLLFFHLNAEKASSGNKDKSN